MKSNSFVNSSMHGYLVNQNSNQLWTSINDTNKIVQNDINNISKLEKPSKYVQLVYASQDPKEFLEIIGNKIDMDIWILCSELLMGESLKYYDSKYLTKEMVMIALEINPECYKYVDRKQFPNEYSLAKLKCV
ncbi:MAG: hypothetical protein ACOC33_00640 [bacterium]